MTKRNKSSVLLERNANKQQRGRIVKDKFLEEKQERINEKPLRALNPKQQKYIEYINTKDLIITTGYAGTSKTYIPTVMACEKLMKNEIKKIVLTRPNISNSKSLGMFKGTLIEKFSPWLAPVLSILTERLGIAELTSALEKGNIEFVPLEVIKGYSAHDCFFICDEAEDLTKDEAKKLVTRQGRNCTMVLAGDITQSELKESSGLKYLMELSNKYPSLLNVGCIDFDNFQEIVRSDQAREWVKVFAREEKENK